MAKIDQDDVDNGQSEADPLYDQMGISLLLGDLVRLVLANARPGSS
jgi:hypothetical protein